LKPLAVQPRRPRRRLTQHQLRIYGESILRRFTNRTNTSGLIAVANRQILDARRPTPRGAYSRVLMKKTQYSSGLSCIAGISYVSLFEFRAVDNISEVLAVAASNEQVDNITAETPASCFACHGGGTDWLDSMKRQKILALVICRTRLLHFSVTEEIETIGERVQLDSIGDRGVYVMLIVATLPSQF
jgi:hypothetical protein